LPLIYALNKTSWLKKRQMINIVKSHNTNRKKVDELFAFVKEPGGIAYAEKVMLEYTQKAKDILLKLPENPARASLLQMVDYTITRKK
jgi:octaprenyl-diphosphate synthase